MFRMPPTIRNESTKKGSKIRLLTIGDIPRAGYIKKSSREITLSAGTFKKCQKYKIEPLDVVMSVSGTIGKIAIVTDSFKEKALPSVNLLVIRFGEDKLANAMNLCMFIKSNQGQKILEKMKTGKAIKRINVKDFYSTKIPVLNAAVKKAAKAAYTQELKLHEKIVESKKSLAELRSKYLKS